MEYYAHRREGRPDSEGHKLKDHLVRTAELAAEFAKPFGGQDWAYLVGLWHDLGKFNARFQEYLSAVSSGHRHETVPHAIWGAALAYHLYWHLQRNAEDWKELSLPICGHHQGLQNGGTLGSDLESFLQRQPDALSLLREVLPGLPTPPRFSSLTVRSPHSREMAIRMVFSAVVDADFLNTEEFFDREKNAHRAKWPGAASLWNVLRTNEAALDREVRDPHSTVNRARRDVRDACLAAANSEAKVFHLTVPTGGGKTRSSLAFALKRIAELPADKAPRRVIVALPYTSIIDQTAHAYRAILGENTVLEHHSQVAVADHEGQSTADYRSRLACENWDAPLVVTTTVQLFESLFGNRPGKVRKLHNIARSVLILDEVQTLPPELLRPVLNGLRIMAEEYGVTVVLSTATQPAFEQVEALPEFKDVKAEEIVPNYGSYFGELQRVTYEIRRGVTGWQEVASALRAEPPDQPPQMMVVLNSRKDALALLDAVAGTEDVFHLSTLLCGAHRRDILAKIRKRLDPRNRRPVRLIATQVVEAGVDLDFPTVWRAMGPLDRIVQAAGRCNREGLRPRESSRVVVFEPEEGHEPRGPYRLGIEKARQLLKDQEGAVLHDPELYRKYFRLLYNDVNQDIARQIQRDREHLDYPKVAEAFRLIRGDTVSVAVNYKDGLKRLDTWKEAPCRRTWQELQPYLVSIYSQEAAALQEEGWLEQVDEGLYQWVGKYDDVRGIRAEYDPSDLIQ